MKIIIYNFLVNYKKAFEKHLLESPKQPSKPANETGFIEPPNKIVDPKSLPNPIAPLNHYSANNEEFTDKLTYDVTDQDDMTSTYKATVTLNVVNNPPVANDDVFYQVDTSVQCTVKDNDSDLNGDLAVH